MTPFSFQYFLALLGFCLVSSATPGPNNIMLLASGLNFGFRRTVPHMLGIIFGFPAMVLLLGLTMATLFSSSSMSIEPVIDKMKWAGAAYLLYLAWRTANAGEVKEGSAAKPLTMLEAAAFQWVNPKAWAMAMAALTTYAVASSLTASAFAVSGSFFACAVLSASIWALFGTSLQRILADPRRRQMFNWSMAALLVASIIPVFFG